MPTKQVLTVKFDLTNVRSAIDEVNAALSHYKVLCDNLAEQRNTVKKERDEAARLYTACRNEREVMVGRIGRALTHITECNEDGNRFPQRLNALEIQELVEILQGKDDE